jgi:hypothetical protein
MKTWKHWFVDEQLYKAIRVEAAHENIGISELISQLCEKALTNKRRRSK